MSSTRVLRITSIFIAAFLFGLAWVGIFRIFHGFLFGHDPQTKPPVAEQRHKNAVAEPVVSMDDPGFTPPQVDENNPETFDPEGVYTPDGAVDPAFGDFELFSINNKKLDVECDSKDFGELTAPGGFVFEANAGSSKESGRTLKFQNIRISSGKLSFITEPLEGISYEFNGDYLVKGNFYTLDPDARVLTGKLIKFSNGKTIAETNVSFTWSIDLDCVC